MTTLRPRHTLLRLSLVLLLLILNCKAEDAAQGNGNQDRFNYRETVGTDYGPEDWQKVRCTDLHECLGWPDDWEAGIAWNLEENSCRWCPEDGNHNCGTHHQSPINLERNRAIAQHEAHNECIDSHWMAYHDR